MTVRSSTASRPLRRPPSGSVAARLEPLITALLGTDLPLTIHCWDGSEIGPPHADLRLTLRRRRALRHLLFEPNELGLARAYVSGDLDLEGDLLTGLPTLAPLAESEAPTGVLDSGLRRRALLTALRLGATGLPPRPPAEEATSSEHRHSRARDAQVIAHHYDLPPDFYRLLLGESMTYSCAYWPDKAVTAGPSHRDADPTHDPLDLAAAQKAKFDLIATKLALRPGIRLLDVGCGWGSFALHAAKQYGVQVVAVTLSKSQAAYARERATDAGLDGRVEIRHQDYRDVDDGPYDAIASIGMAEHVGASQLSTYAAALFDLLSPRGRLLNQAISRRPQSTHWRSSHSFIDRYVFPDGELVPLALLIDALETSGFEVRDVDALREHYPLTLHAWVRNLEQNWHDAIDLVGEARARIWRLYIAGSAVAFERDRIGVNQVLAVKPDESGRSGLPRRRPR